MTKLVQFILSLFTRKPVPPVQTHPIPAPPVAKPKPAVVKAPEPAPRPTGTMGDVWDWCYHEATDGIPEEPNRDNRGPVIQRYVDLAKCGAQGDAYCAIFINAGLEKHGIRGTRSALARSFANSPHFVKLDGPAHGAIAVFWRGANRNVGTGHVGLYDHETQTHVYTLGANQGDDCNISPFRKNGQNFGLIGYYWPKGHPLPPIKAVLRGTSSNIKDTKAT